MINHKCLLRFIAYNTACCMVSGMCMHAWINITELGAGGGRPEWASLLVYFKFYTCLGSSAILVSLTKSIYWQNCLEDRNLSMHLYCVYLHDIVVKNPRCFNLQVLQVGVTIIKLDFLIFVDSENALHHLWRYSHLSLHRIQSDQYNIFVHWMSILCIWTTISAPMLVST